MEGVAEHACYWSSCQSISEADYLCAILSSEKTRELAEKWQAEGMFGKQHFDKAVFNLPIPPFDSKVENHRDLAVAGMSAELIAALVEVKEGEYFTRTRKRIRQTLIEDGIAGEIDKLVEKLLGPV